MVILLPVFLMLLTSTALFFMRLVRPNFKYTWILAIGGATLALIGVFFWQIHIPQTISLPPWQPATLLEFSPTWVADGSSWPYALSLAALASAVIWTSVVRAENDPSAWAATLLLSALGILAVSAENPLTLILAWSAIDLAELIALIRSTEGEKRNREVIIAFSARLVGTGLLIWVNLISQPAGNPLNFFAIPQKVGIYLVIAAGLRLGVFPLHLPYRKENVLRRGFGTSLRLVSSAASLSLLARVPTIALRPFLLPSLIILAALAALYAGWMWLRASDEILGRPYWVLGMAALAISASLRGNPTGSIGWGVIMVLGGGLVFLFSARQRNITWLPLLSLWGLSALPFSAASSGWETGNQISRLYIIPFLPAQALLMSGVIRHSLHPGETSFESQERWTKFLYPTGLLLLAAVMFTLGVWGWNGARNIGLLWAAIISNILAVGVTALALTFLVRLSPVGTSTKRSRIFRLDWLYNLLKAIYEFLCRTAEIITSSLEGDGGLLWSLLLLALILSILSTQAQ